MDTVASNVNFLGLQGQFRPHHSGLRSGKTQQEPIQDTHHEPGHFLRSRRRRGRTCRHRHGTGGPARRPLGHPRGPRSPGAFRRAGTLGLRRHGTGWHAAAAASEDSRHPRARPARLAALWRARSNRPMADAVGPPLRRTFPPRGLRLASRRRPEIPAGSQLGRTGPVRRWQQPAPLSHCLGHRPGAGPLPGDGIAPADPGGA